MTVTTLAVANPALSLEERKRTVAKILGESYSLKVDKCNGCGRDRLVIAFDNPVACETYVCGDCLICAVVVMWVEGGYRPWI